MKYTISDAIHSLRPVASWELTGSEYSGLEWLDSNTTKPTETEINNKISELDSAEAMRLLREVRNQLLSETDWVAARSIETGVAMSNDWKTYRQALRDLPASSSPTLDSEYDLNFSSVTWPTEPS